MSRTQFQPNPPDAAGVVSWIHFGDLHMQLESDQNYKDLLSLVRKVNADFANAISFVMLPGDNANEGSKRQYEVLRSALDQLHAPWCAIVGDHDMHEKSFENFLQYMQPKTHYEFAAGQLHFFALNAFSTPHPEAFELDAAQLDWLESGLKRLSPQAHAVVFLHCYPSEIRKGGDRLRALIAGPRVLLVDMGHTHYNEVSNDGNTIYTATRSTGQIEEGPAGFSVTNVDGDVVSWKFLPLAESALVMITSPADYRFVTASNTGLTQDKPILVRAKVWGAADSIQIRAEIEGHKIELHRVEGSNVFEGTLIEKLGDGMHELVVTASGEHLTQLRDAIRIRVGRDENGKPRGSRDLDNALDAWPERGLLGTQLGPNKNGRKW